MENFGIPTLSDEEEYENDYIPDTEDEKEPKKEEDKNPLSDEEKAVTDEAINLEEYYKVLTRDEIIEKLTKIYESDDSSSGGTSTTTTTTAPSSGDVSGMMKQADSSLSFN